MNAGTTTFESFTSCTSSGQDFFSTVNGIVTNLFAGEGVSITAFGSYSPGPGTGAEFSGDRSSAGFLISPNSLNNNNSFTFNSLPTGTLFVSLKQANGFELFRVPDAFLLDPATDFTLAHSLGNSTSHISTFAGTAPTPTAPVPVPAAGLLLLSGLGGMAIAGWRKRRATA